MKRVLKKQSTGLEVNINNIYIFGDSFSANGSNPLYNESQTYVFWVDMLNVDYPTFAYAEGSRDLQTILDTWIKVLPNLDKDDCIVVGIPCFSRWRIPKHESEYTIENEQIVRHIGHTGPSEIKVETVIKNGIEERLFENEIINSSKASSLNYKEVIESLTKLSKCKVILWSWTQFDEEFKPAGLYDKTDLENELGYWGTMQDVFNRTNGQFGIIGDMHWDEKTQKLFYAFIKKEIEK